MSFNISKKKKEEMLAKITIIKDFIDRNSKVPSLMEYLIMIENEIKNKKYGLVFEEYEEDIRNINEICLSEKKELSIEVAVDGKKNMLIEGENLEALILLIQEYREKINIICIDPPYNTGNKTLKYNDYDYMDLEDEYDHSKWLSFMEKRLKISKDLLVPNGVLFVNIDETQISCLILLCEKIFGEENIDVLIWPKMDPKYDKNRVEKPIFNVKVAHEYVVMCYKNKSSTFFNKMKRRPNHSDFGKPEQLFYMETILNEIGTTSSAKDELNEIFGTRDISITPKPRKMIKEFVRVAAGPNAIILDFFAGSGTTGHAVMDLNKEDGGKRKFILVTDNENNICIEITYERLKRAIYKDNFTENLKYLRIESKQSF
ncbi:MAG: site-specific DNA-methyltransferase [Patescibacteria group bacterium]|nr:site-specific DNA-methyltransferase [Patescibacteria group bacterium]